MLTSAGGAGIELFPRAIGDCRTRDDAMTKVADRFATTALDRIANARRSICFSNGNIKGLWLPAG